MPTLIKLRLLQGRRSPLIDDEDDDPSKFSSDSESEDAQQSTKLSKSRVSQRHRNREATIAHVSGRYTIDIIFARLSTKFFVEKLRGPLLQPEVRAVQVTILIHAAHSCSFHACYYMTLPLSTGSRSSFRSRRFYRPKIFFDRDTNKCFDKDRTEYLDKYHNKHINNYKKPS